MARKAFRRALFVAATALAASSCERSTSKAPSSSNNPRAVIREHIQALETLNEKAFLETLGGGQDEYTDLALSFFALQRQAGEFEQKFLAAYGKRYWTHFQSTLGRHLFYFHLPMLQAYERNLADLPVVYDGDVAFMPSLNSRTWLKFLQRPEGGWYWDPRNAFGLEMETDPAELQRLFEGARETLKEYAAEVGEKGVTARALAEQMASKSGALWKTTIKLPAEAFTAAELPKPTTQAGPETKAPPKPATSAEPRKEAPKPATAP